MQVTPALPWDNTVQGGTILLREPLTLQQLLNGALDVELKDGHAELVEGSFEIYPSDNKLYLGGSSLDYRITNVDTSSSYAQYSELILEKTLSADETLYSVSVHVPDVIVSPSLPWSDTIEEGVIQLKEPLSMQQLLDNALIIILKNNDNELKYSSFEINDSDNKLYIDTDDFDWCITNVDTSDSSAIYSELVLKKALGNQTTLVAVGLKSDIIVIPDLPIEPGSQGEQVATIVTSNIYTKEQLLAGALDFVLEDRGENHSAILVEDERNGVQLVYPDAEHVKFVARPGSYSSFIPIITGSDANNSIVQISRKLCEIPQLPWQQEDEYGTILLPKQLTLNEILHGAISIELSDGTNRVRGEFISPQAGRLYLRGNDTNIYSMANLDSEESTKYWYIDLELMNYSTNLRVSSVDFNDPSL